MIVYYNAAQESQGLTYKQLRYSHLKFNLIFLYLKNQANLQ